MHRGQSPSRWREFAPPVDLSGTAAILGYSAKFAMQHMALAKEASHDPLAHILLLWATTGDRQIQARQTRFTLPIEIDPPPGTFIPK